MKNVVPNATMTVLHELTGDGAARQALWVKGYLSTSSRIVPERANIMLNTDTQYEQLVADSLAILIQMGTANGVSMIVAEASHNPESFKALAKEVFSKALNLPIKGVDLQLVCEDLLSLDKPVADMNDTEQRRAFHRYLLEQFQAAYYGLVRSMNKTLEKGARNNSAYTHSAERRDDEVRIYETFGQGIKVHLVTGNLHVQGLEVNRVIVKPGMYKAVRSKAKTLAKKALRDQLPLAKWRQLVLRRGKFEAVLIRDRRFGPKDFAPPEE